MLPSQRFVTALLDELGQAVIEVRRCHRRQFCASTRGWRVVRTAVIAATGPKGRRHERQDNEQRFFHPFVTVSQQAEQVLPPRPAREFRRCGIRQMNTLAAKLSYSARRTLKSAQNTSAPYSDMAFGPNPLQVTVQILRELPSSSGNLPGPWVGAAPDYRCHRFLNCGITYFPNRSIECIVFSCGIDQNCIIARN